MKADINQIWHELWVDHLTVAALWQLTVIAGCLLLAWSINGLLRAYVMRSAPENWRISIGGVNRVIFPLSSLVFVSVGQIILQNWQHTSMLKLASSLLLAMAVIRLAVYALRYIFASGGWVRAMETTIATSVWLVWALHLSGLLPQILQMLEEISFNIGKTPVTLLLLMKGLFTVLITLIIALWLSRMLENKVMCASQISMNMRVVLSKLIRIVLSLLAILMALSAVGLDITFLSVFGGALGVGLGFGLQKIASNYVSGFILLTDHSMHMGDVITVDSHYGVVSEMRTRYMVLRKLDNTEVVIPNETLITSAVINHSLSDRKTRIQMQVQVSYESPLELAMQLMHDAAVQQVRILKDPEPAVLIKGFGESGIELSLSAWIADPEEGSAALQSAIYLNIWRSFQANSISIPYPQREVRILGAVT
jgi:small-conductance mechanosensitive channel